MQPVIRCPGKAQLEAFARGDDLGAAGVWIARHLEDCAACRAVLAGVVSVVGTRTHARGQPTPGHDAFRTLDPAAAGRSAAPASRDDFSFLFPPEEPDEIGRLADYRVLRLLGRGGMGYVFLAEDVALRRPVALKVMNPKLHGDGDGWQRFLREARTLAAIKHEHLVTIYRAGQEGDVCYFAMELLSGETLEARLARGPRLETPEILRLGREIASGLACLHENHLIHRDIKPANLWLEAPHGRVKILDLGIARQVNDANPLTLEGTVLGTPGFMSPEQARGDAVDARSDLFSLGCVLYCLCTGRRPFREGGTMATLSSLALDTPEHVRELNPKLPGALADLVMQLLAKTPKKRPESAAEVRERLDDIERDPTRPMPRQQGVLVSAEDTGIKDPARPTGRARRQGPALAVWAVLGVVALAVVVGVAVTLGGWLLRPPPPPVDPYTKESVFVVELEEVDREHWPMKGPKGGGKKMDTTVRVQGKVSPHGIFMHPPPPDRGKVVSLSFDLRGQFETFQADVSLNDGPPPPQWPATFHVYGDGKLLWESKEVRSQQNAQRVRVSVKGVQVLRLAVTCAGPGHGVHAVWIEPAVAK
jgi:hypothetical protein